MSLLQREREIITRNEYVERFDFEEIEAYVRGGEQRALHLPTV